MKQAIAGVAPAETQEAHVMTVWPSVACYPLGRTLGQLFEIKTGTYIFTLGNLFALLSIPIALPLYFLRVAPFLGVRYTLTNKRIIVQRGIAGKREERSLLLTNFDTIQVQVQPGQAWYEAGDLVFLREGSGVEAFRLEGVSRPESFRQICEKSRMARAGVLKAAERQAASSQAAKPAALAT